MIADVTFLTARGPAVTGHEAVRRLYANLFTKFEITVADAQCSVDVLGDVAVVVGQQTTTLGVTPSGRALTVVNRTVAIYRRESGSWRLARALSAMATKASSGGTPAVRHVSELLRRAQAEPGRMIYPEVA
jgi:ketosteroid isomerase-like protein